MVNQSSAALIKILQFWSYGGDIGIDNITISSKLWLFITEYSENM